MRRGELAFPRPLDQVAREPPEISRGSRDEVRLLVSRQEGHRSAAFRDLPRFLEPGDLLVVNESATIPASLPAEGEGGAFLLNLCTRFGPRLYLAEPRRSFETPGPLPLAPGARVVVSGVRARFLEPFPGISRLWFVSTVEDLLPVLPGRGSPIHYGYVGKSWPLSAYQTLFSRVPGSVEMPSAGRPFTPRLMEALSARGVGLATVVLHCGVSSLEVESDRLEDQPLYPEPFRVPEATARAVNGTRLRGHRVVAVGTTVVRALESSWEDGKVQPRQGFTRLYVRPPGRLKAVQGLITGLHDPLTSHLALLFALGPPRWIREAYQLAVESGFLWHEFGDSHLLLPEVAGTAR